MTALASRPRKGVLAPGRVSTRPAGRKPVLKAHARIELSHRVFADGGVEVRIMGLRLVSEANQREFWATRHARKVGQQLVVGSAISSLKLSKRFGTGPLQVRFVRIGPRRMDMDNCAGACKHVQDQLARNLGRDDGDELISWTYAQKRIDARTYGLVIEISHAAKVGE